MDDPNTGMENIECCTDSRSAALLNERTHNAANGNLVDAVLHMEHTKNNYNEMWMHTVQTCSGN